MSSPRLAVVLPLLALLLITVGGAYVAPYLKTMISDESVETPAPASETDTVEGTSGTPTTIITGTVLVKASPELAVQLHEILSDETRPPLYSDPEEETLDPTELPLISSPEVLGTHTITDAFSVLPVLESIGATNITPITPLPPLTAATELPAIDRWFEITLPIPTLPVKVADSGSLSPTQPPQESPPAEATTAVAQTKDSIDNLKASGQFETVEPVIEMTIAAIPNDPFFSSNDTGIVHDDLWGIKRIQAPAAWDITTGSPNTVIAVIDTGIDHNHRDLRGNIYENPGETGFDAQNRNKQSNGVDDDNNGYIDDWRGWDFYNNDNNPTDDNDHGTHVAGTIAAVGNNNTDVVGVMWQAKLLPIKFLGSYGGGTDVGGAAALRYAADMGARAINNSWGGEGFSLIIQDAVDYAHAKGSLVIVAAGNSKCDLAACETTPAGLSNTLAVSAMTPADTRAWFSNYGDKIALTAPGGGEICRNKSCAIRIKGDKILSLTIGNKMAWFEGTSMATPHVTGAAGLVFAQHPEWTNEQVRQRLQETATDIGQPGKDHDFGHGVVNVAAAIGGKSVDVKFTAPASKDFYGSYLTLQGTVSGSNLRSYQTESSWDRTPIQWSLVQRNTTPVVNSALGMWWRPISFAGQRLYRLSINPDQTDRIQIVRSLYMSWNPPSAAPWRNPNNRYDVNGDQNFTPQDILVLVNEKNRAGFRELPSELPSNDKLPPPFIDVTGDGLFDQGDVDAAQMCLAQNTCFF